MKLKVLYLPAVRHAFPGTFDQVYLQAPFLGIILEILELRLGSLAVLHDLVIGLFHCLNFR